MAKAIINAFFNLFFVCLLSLASVPCSMLSFIYERKGKERKGKERKEERKGKERKGKERKEKWKKDI